MAFVKDGKTVYQMSDEELRGLTQEELRQLSTEEYQARHNQLYVSDDMAEKISNFNDPDHYDYDSSTSRLPGDNFSLRDAWKKFWG